MYCCLFLKPGDFQKISCMAAGAALQAMLDILLCHAQQDMGSSTTRDPAA
jgi:hypothetical protein